MVLVSSFTFGGDVGFNEQVRVGVLKYIVEIYGEVLKNMDYRK